MPNTAIIKFTAPTPTSLTVAATTSAPLIWQQLIHTS